MSDLDANDVNTSSDRSPALVTNIIDRSVKLLFRERPDALLRLAGVQGIGEEIRFEDANLNLPELRADHVLRIQPNTDDAPYALCAEYQLRPDASLWPQWGNKWCILSQQLKIPVVLLVVYLEKGDRATFPDRYGVNIAGLTTQLRFTAVRLWEHRDRIESGELAELAPLLVLCEEKPTEQTVRREIELLHEADLSSDVRSALLGVAMLLASRSFAREILEVLFQEDLAMIDQMENLKELFFEVGALEKWADSTGISARLRAEGEAKGRAEGESQTAHAMLLTFLTARFGDLPQPLIGQIEQSDANSCQTLFHRALQANTLSELIADLG